MGACVAFLWHMHQPYYKDPLSGNYLMPWVRLHATKGYYDMIHILDAFPEIRQTFNLVPSLIDQMQEYALGQAQDKILQLTLKPAAELHLDDKKYLLANFFMVNWDNLVLPHPRYKRLLQKRGMKLTPKELEHALKEYTAQDFLDLQVLFNLTWFGFRARKKYLFLKELDQKQKNFTEEEKLQLIHTQRQVISEVLPAYQRKATQGQVEITFSPYYHPILPLLMDTQIAQRQMPWAHLPVRFNHPEDAKVQVEKACARYQQLFGRSLQGMWPSEGSVCPELIPLLAEAGIQWVATDEENLLHTVQVKDRGKALYKPYRVECHGKSVEMIFRDRGLSDLIGFTYAKNDPVTSAQDFVSHLQAIAQYNEKEKNPALISLILDGENPWEYYKDGGEVFLQHLYQSLNQAEHLKTVTVSEYLKKYPAKERLNNINSGSWIGHNFDIWIGDVEENEAWNYLKRTRDFLVNFIVQNPKIAKEQLEGAWEEIYRAEGSDWFWWYGEDFATAHDEEFDQLFRTHLANVYRILDQPVPDYVNHPIQGFKSVKVVEKPLGFVSPTLDGLSTHFYEWQEGGCFQMKKGSTMHKAETLLEAIHYGFDLNHLYFRLDPVRPKDGKIPEGLSAQLVILKKQTREFLIAFSFRCDEKLKQFELYRVLEDQSFQKIKDYDTIAAKKIVELAIPIKDLNLVAEEEVDFFVQILINKTHLERYPRSGTISFPVPGKFYDKEMWSA